MWLSVGICSITATVTLSTFLHYLFLIYGLSKWKTFAKVNANASILSPNKTFQPLCLCGEEIHSCYPKVSYHTS